MKKKYIYIIVLFIITFLILLYKNSQKEEIINYKIDNFTIEEHAYKNNMINYDFLIKHKKNTYVFTREENTNFKKKIIKNIKIYKSNNLECIYPIFKNISSTYIYCTNNYQQVSINYLIQTNNEDFKIVKNKLKKYKIIYPTNNDVAKKYKKIAVYNKNILDNETIVIWNYKGIYVLNRNKNNYIKIIDYDLYDNIMATITDNYYVIFENTSVEGITKINYYDMNNNKLKTYTLKKVISKDSYINGSINDLIYVTDNKKKMQYEIDIKKNTITEVNKNNNIYITYKNNKKKELSKGDFFKEKQIFDINKNKYKYKLDNNKIYKYYKNSSVLLLEMNGIEEWNAINDEIIILKEGIIYSYTDKYGLREIVESNELNYNYKNIYKIWKK